MAQFQPVQFKLVQDLGETPETRAPGMGEWVVHRDSTLPDKIAALAFICPCGCGTETMVGVMLPDAHPRWQWNGDREKPDLEPSIQRNHGCHWHGFLKRGWWVANREDAPA